MEEKLKLRYEEQAKIIKAMAHPTRLFIIDQLSKEDKCVCELTKMIGDDVSTVSKHLSVLKNAGIVKSKKIGTKMIYKLTVPCVVNFFECTLIVMKKNAEEKQVLIK